MNSITHFVWFVSINFLVMMKMLTSSMFVFDMYLDLTQSCSFVITLTTFVNFTCGKMDVKILLVLGMKIAHFAN